MTSYPKHIKRMMRQWLGEAYERELKTELARLDQDFTEWRTGGIINGELACQFTHVNVPPIYGHHVPRSRIAASCSTLPVNIPTTTN